MNLREFRATIPAVGESTYLNTGASSPDSVPVVESMQTFLEQHGYDAPTEGAVYSSLSDVFDETRAAVAEFLNARPGEIALTQSTGDGVSRVANAIPWEPGNTVVRTDLEHPAGVVPWQVLERRDGVTVEVLETADGHVDTDDMKEAVEDAKLLCLSSMTRNYGTRLPVERITDIAHDAGTPVLVDAVQSVGQTPVDVTEWGADYVAAASHKWLVGPWGAGFLYVAEDAVPDLRPTHASYRSVDRDTEPYELHPDARRLEVGTTSPAPYVGLQTAIETLSAVGVDAVEERIRTLTTMLKRALPDSTLASPTEFESGIVTIDDETPAQTARLLAEYDVRVRSIAEPEAVRVSVHGFNDESDVRAFLSAYDEVR